MRCERQEASYQMWAIKWGRALVDILTENPPTDDVRRLERELDEAEERSAALQRAMEDAIDDMQRVI